MSCCCGGGDSGDRPCGARRNELSLLSFILPLTVVVSVETMGHSLDDTDDDSTDGLATDEDGEGADSPSDGARYTGGIILKGAKCLLLLDDSERALHNEEEETCLEAFVRITLSEGRTTSGMVGGGPLIRKELLS